MKSLLIACALVLGIGIASFPASAQKKDTETSLRKGAKISMEQAERAALSKEPGTIKTRELEKEKGKLIYSFDIRTQSGIHEVNVDALTGEVIEDSVETKA